MRRFGLISLAVLPIALVGVIASRVAGGDAPHGTSPTNTPVESGSGSEPTEAETTVSRQTDSTVNVEQVRIAAMDAVAMTDDVVRAGFISRRELISGFTTATFGPRLADETSAQVSALLLELGERDAGPADLAVIEQPLTADIVAVDDQAAVVEVWSVMVVVAPGAGPARQVWRTVSVDLQYVGGRWLVDGWLSSLGPTPALAPGAAISDAASVGTAVTWGAGDGGDG